MTWNDVAEVLLIFAVAAAAFWAGWERGQLAAYQKSLAIFRNNREEVSK